MLADESAVGADIKLRIEKRAESIRHFLTNANHHIGICHPRCRAESICLDAWNFDRVLKELYSQFVGDFSGRRMMVKPDRVCGDEPLRETNDACAMGTCFRYETAGFLDRRFAIQKC